MEIVKLIKDQGWKIICKEENGKNSYLVKTPYEDDIGLLNLRHPAWLHLELYRKLTVPDLKYQHLKKARDIFWPTKIWHDWTERRFRAHCEDWNFISQAGGGSKGKSYDWADIAILFYFANPLERRVTVASTTLASLKGRVWGYLTASIKDMRIQPQYTYKVSPNPQVLPIIPDHLVKAKGRGKITDDTLHGMFAVTARLGDDDQAVASWIGYHPKDKLLVILDEGTDMPMSITNTFANLNSHPEKFQLAIIGNSKSTNDMHGVLSTPLNGWDSVSIDIEQWRTVQPNGICQYFNPYRCPAITHPDPEMRKTLSRFLIGKENLQQKERELGVDSEQFYRFVLGFWKSKSTENTTVSDKFLKDFSPRKAIQWSGYYPIQRVASFDFAISQDGDNPMISIANVGQDIDGGVKVDFAGSTSLFKLHLSAIADKSFERQLAEQVVDLLTRYGVKMTNFAIDVTGQGRAIGEVIMMVNEKKGYPLGIGTPLKIYSMSQHNKNKRKESAPDLCPMSTHELYLDFRSYIEKDSIRGLDETTINQLVNRQIERKGDRVFLESKKDYKRRMSAIGNPHSPDEADARALCIQVVKQRLGIYPGLKWKTPEREQAQGYFNKIYAMAREMQKPVSNVKPALPKISFSKGLEHYAKFKR